MGHVFQAVFGKMLIRMVSILLVCPDNSKCILCFIHKCRDMCIVSFLVCLFVKCKCLKMKDSFARQMVAEFHTTLQVEECKIKPLIYQPKETLKPHSNKACMAQSEASIFDQIRFSFAVIKCPNYTRLPKCHCCIAKKASE